MHPDIDALTERFDKSLLVLMHNLGPQLIARAHLGLTPGQVFMLHFLKKERQCSVSRLAEKLEVAPSAITVMLDRLEAHGVVTRSRDRADRRVVVIELTEVGERKLQQVVDARRQIIQHCLAQVEPTALDIFIQRLEGLADAAQAMEIKEIIGTRNGVE